MKDKAVYGIKFIGFSNHERKILDAIFRLSQARPITCNFFAESKSNKPQIIIVDFDTDKAIREWQALCIQNVDYLTIPNIRITYVKPMDTENYYAKRPFTASKLLQLLDSLVAREFDSDAGSMLVDEQLTRARKISKKSTQIVAEKSALVLFNSVLLIEDSLPVQMHIHATLDGYAKHIDLTRTGSDALKLIKQNSYDIIFLDTMLPDADGYDVYRSIKQNKQSKTTPIVMLVGHLPEAERSKKQLDKGDDYLIKPVKRELFEKIIFRYTADAQTSETND